MFQQPSTGVGDGVGTTATLQAYAGLGVVKNDSVAPAGESESRHGAGWTGSRNMNDEGSRRHQWSVDDPDP